MSWTKLYDNWFRAIDGNAAIAFALCLLPIGAIMSSVSDLKAHQSYEANLEDAVELATVTVARYAYPGDLSSAELLGVARNVLDDELSRYRYLEWNDIDLTVDADVVSLEVSGRKPSSVLSLMGRDSLPFSAEAKAQFGPTPSAEVALVLDTSLSMKGSRLAALQDAAKSMINSLVNSDEHSVRMSIIPFSTYVNVGTDKHAEPWLEVEPERSGAAEQCSIDQSWYEAKCARRSYDCSRDGVKRTCLRWDCFGGDIKNAPQSCRLIDWNERWHGCVKSRPSPYNISDNGFLDERVVGIATRQASTCPTAIQELTDNGDELAGTIENLTVQEETYIAPGLAWGLRTLSGGAPFSGADPYDDVVSGKARKTLILMSDGANTRSPTKSGDHTGENRKRADRNTLAACDLIKSKNIELYTVSFEVDDRETKQMLRRCATNSKFYFDADGSGELSQIFETISDNFVRVQLID